MTSIVILPPVVYKLLLSVPYTANSVNYSQNLEAGTKTAALEVCSHFRTNRYRMLYLMSHSCVGHMSSGSLIKTNILDAFSMIILCKISVSSNEVASVISKAYLNLGLMAVLS